MMLVKFWGNRILFNIIFFLILKHKYSGRAITKTGLGSVIEAFQRTYKFGAILGGSEEIMADLGVRQALKQFPINARL